MIVGRVELGNYFINTAAGFITNRVTGSKWRAISVCSEVDTGRIFDMNWGNGPFFVLLSISREYTAPNTVAIVINGVDSVFQSMMAESISSSPIKLGVGGSPSFVTQVTVHHRVSRGATSLNPRVIDSVRVLFRSYSSLARQNRADDMSP